jgi:hypothetical protein
MARYEPMNREIGIKVAVRSARKVPTDRPNFPPPISRVSVEAKHEECEGQRIPLGF